LLGAYRDHEVDDAHPLMRKLDAIRKAGVQVREIGLKPLARDDLEQLIADALASPSNRRHWRSSCRKRPPAAPSL
jgi:predicted ATPase